MERDSFVCVCNSVTYGTIEDAINNGAQNHEDIMEETGAGSFCGGCIQLIEEILDRLVVR